MGCRPRAAQQVAADHEAVEPAAQAMSGGDLRAMQEFAYREFSLLPAPAGLPSLGFSAGHQKGNGCLTPVRVQRPWWPGAPPAGPAMAARPARLAAGALANEASLA